MLFPSTLNTTSDWVEMIAVKQKSRICLIIASGRYKLVNNIHQYYKIAHKYVNEIVLHEELSKKTSLSLLWEL
jgi:hypothetical protein